LILDISFDGLLFAATGATILQDPATGTRFSLVDIFFATAPIGG
jgi:hypothetical protein